MMGDVYARSHLVTVSSNSWAMITSVRKHMIQPWKSVSTNHDRIWIGMIDILGNTVWIYAFSLDQSRSRKSQKRSNHMNKHIYKCTNSYACIMRVIILTFFNILAILTDYLDYFDYLEYSIRPKKVWARANEASINREGVQHCRRRYAVRVSYSSPRCSSTHFLPQKVRFMWSVADGVIVTITGDHSK